MAILNHPEFGRFNIYDGSNDKQLITDLNKVAAPGYTGRNYEKFPYGSMPWANYEVKPPPRSDWKEIIDRGNREKRWSLFHHRAKKVPILNQQRTNYCWMFAPVGALMDSRAAHGLPTIDLSPASAAAPGKNYQNVGGWTGEALGYIEKYGLVPTEQWPATAIDHSYYQKTREFTKPFNVGTWWELAPRDFAMVMAVLFEGWDVVVGLNWWRHAVRYAAPIYTGNSFGVIMINSWGGDWEDGGMTVLMEEKATPDEVNALSSPRLATGHAEKSSAYEALSA